MLVVFVGLLFLSTPASASKATGASGASLKATDDGFKYTTSEEAKITAWAEGGELVLVDEKATAFDRALPDGCVAEPVDAGIGARCTARGDQVLKIITGEGNDWIWAADLTRRFDLDVRTGPGEDVVQGGSGNDRIDGGDGRDTLYGGAGDDLVIGGEGNDYVRGHGGNDELRGGEGLNFIFGDGGDDVLRGGSSFEYFTGGRGDDVIYAGGGNDDIGAGAGNDIVHGGDGDDEIRGGAGQDQLFGGAGDDLIRARDGESDTIQCGAGNDVARVDAGEVDEAKRSCEKVKQEDSAIVEEPDLD